MDFTLKIYKQLLQTLQKSGYTFFTFQEYCEGKRAEKMIILRHDVDLKPQNSLAVARIERKLNIRASYYFRAIPESWGEEIIREMVSLGHEIGYHYETLTTCRGDIDRAYALFLENLSKLRGLATVETICMHGSPKSKWDSKDLWSEYNYRELDIIGEPYFDADFSDLFYLTDTGRRWDGYKVSVRDKIPQYQDEWVKSGLVYRSTEDILKSVAAETFPLRAMITTHPQRWSDHLSVNIKEYLLQNLKNTVKRILISSRKNNI